MPRHEMETFYAAQHNACRYVLRLPSPYFVGASDRILDWKAHRPLPMGTGTIPAKRFQVPGRGRGDSLYNGRI
jgi:hypothetical protein